MDTSEIDKRIELAERRVLMVQNRLIDHRDKLNQLIRRLEREAHDLEEIKKEWINKRNTEDDRARMESRELAASHRHAIEDLRIKYEEERQNKLRDLKMAIAEKEVEINEWRRKRDEAAMRTRTEEAKIKSGFQDKLSAILRDERSAIRTGVVRQKRLLQFCGK